jgi:hypothetical protein
MSILRIVTTARMCAEGSRGSRPARSPRRAGGLDRIAPQRTGLGVLQRPGGSRNALARYVLYRSYVLLDSLPIEPISHPIRACVPLGKAQRLDRQAYESPALPLSYSATAAKFIERDPERQPTE